MLLPLLQRHCASARYSSPFFNGEGGGDEGGRRGQCSSPSKMADTFDVSKRLLIDICQTERDFFYFISFFRHVVPMGSYRTCYMWIDG